MNDQTNWLELAKQIIEPVKCYHCKTANGVVPIFRCTDDAVIGAECYQCVKARQMAELEEIEEERAAIALERGE